nr:alpha amylase C-terminal domain-containing protein [Deltaproteobacteria bacterium]
MHTKVRRGARELEGGGAEFVLWAPSHGNVQIERVDVRAEGLTAPVLPTEMTEDGHWVARGRIVAPKVFYDFEVHALHLTTGKRFTRVISDPYAREVHRDFRSVLTTGELARPAPFVRPALRDLLIYELHVYNFTAEDPTVRGEVRGTYAGVIAKLPHLRSLGVNAIELMPVFDYSDPWQVGIRWNYITACHLFAPHRGYAAHEDGARAEFIQLVNACHEAGIAVIVDAVFNQVSRRFSYARIYDPNDDPRGAAPDCGSNPLLGNFGGTDPNPGSEPYRDKDWGGVDLDYARPAAMAFVRDVVRVWFDELGIDGMRFDHTLGFYHWKDQTVGAGAVAEATREIGGDGCYRIAEHFSNDQNELELLKDSAFNSMWAKGFYYAVDDALHDRGLAHLEYRMNVRAQGFPDDKPPVVFLDNHDDERLSNRGAKPWWRIQTPTIALLTHPGVPMLYMGCEYAEDDRTRFASGLPREHNPLDWAQTEATAPLLRLHRAMGFLRERLPALRSAGMIPIWRHEKERVLIYGRGEHEPEVIVALNFHEEPQSVRVPAPGGDGEWHEFLFNLKFMAHGGAMQFHGSDGVIYDRVLVPGSYAHIYCRHRVWSDPEWVELFAVDRT